MNEALQTSLDLSTPGQLEAGQQLIRGEITPAQFLGLSQKRLYEMATLGHNLMAEGQLEGALDIFKGLVAASPYDSVFHLNLAATYTQLQRFPEAMEEYTRALQLNVANVDALVGRSELLLREGKVTEALQDLQLALQLDPEARRETTQRAHATLSVLQSMADEAEKAQAAQP
jgi:tetratricopeptide (TPR) repeat protein